MKRFFCALLVIAGGCAVLASPAMAKESLGPPVKAEARSDYAHILVHFDNLYVAQAALKVADAAWGPVARMLGRKGAKPTKPLEIHLLETPEDYRAVDEELTGGRFARNNAMAHWDTRSAWIAVVPRSCHQALERIGLPVTVQRVVAHEYAHLAIFDQLPNFRHHPDWLAEGLALLVEDEAIEAAGLVERLEQRPLASQRMRNLKKLLASGRLPEIPALIRDRLPGLEMHDRYAAWWGWMRFLLEGERAPRMLLVLRRVPRMPADGRLGRDLIAGLDLLLGNGRGTFRKLEREFHEWIEALSPAWSEYWRMLDTRDDAWCHAAYADLAAISLRTEPPKSGDYDLAGRVELADLAEGEASVLFAQKGERHVALHVRPGRGLVLATHEALQGPASVVVEVPWPRDVGAKPLPFRIRVRGSSVQVFAAGKAILDHVFEEPLPVGPWGLRVAKDQLAFWHDVRLVEP